MVLSRSARQAPAYPTVSPRFTSRTVSTVVSSVITGLSPWCRPWSLPNGETPYSARPGRTQSPCASRPAQDGRGIADARREPLRPGRHSLPSEVAENGSSCVPVMARRVHRRAPGASSRAAPARGTVSARRRASAIGKFSGRNPRRFMPVSIFIQMMKRRASRCASSSLICSGSCTTSSKR